MAEAPDRDQKTEEPTPRKLEEAARKGDVPIAAEIRHVVMFAAILAVTGALGMSTIRALGTLFVGLWGNAGEYALAPEGAADFATGFLGAVAGALLPILGALFGFALVGGLLQGRPMLSWARLKPKWSKLNPFSGIGRLFGKQALVEFAKTLVKLMLVFAVAAMVAWPHAAGIDHMVGADPVSIAARATALVQAMVKPVLIVAGGIALFDILWQRRAWIAKMRMSLQEIKDEHKEQEGDPKIKAKIRTIQMQRSRRRMMAAVPRASVVITNPTHYAVALQYDHGAMAAPVVVAKGVDGLALKIRAVAAEHGVPIVENRPLARALYAAAEIDRPIPVEHYAAVAEVISFVLRLARARNVNG